ncbi:helix-turn-helix transcriptional regulator [Roseateles sp.]|uniref:helix-turn-helix transcriptional regulator n=1 Tax=Roseateles sp. TaxID=1971397 RepID=UPI0039EC3AEE
MSMGLAVLAAREAAKLTAADLAKMAGITASSLSRTENGLRALELVEADAIAKAVGLDIPKLLSLAETFERDGAADRRSQLQRDLNALERLAYKAAIEAQVE